MALRPPQNQAQATPSAAPGGVLPNADASHARERVTEEQLRMIWAHVRLAVLVATCFAVAVCLALRGVVATPAVVYGWLAVKLMVSAGRTLQGWRFGMKARPGPQWVGYTLVGLVLDAAVWGAAGFYVALTAPWPMASFFSAVMACLACVATFGLQVSARFTACYAIPILMPTGLGLFLRGGLYGELGGLGMLLLLGLQVATAARSQARLEEGVNLRLQAEALALEKAEALKAAVRQGAVRTQFLANISHELRTPLHGILGMAKLLQTSLHEPVLRQRADLIASSGAHLLSLINDLLDLSRIDAGQFLIRKERHDLSAQVSQLASIYAMRCEEKGLRFVLCDALPTTCWVLGDPARYRQVLHNLLGNAVKFTQQGEVKLIVGQDVDSGVIRAEVHDTGPGIPQADLSRIFEAFQQSDLGVASMSYEGAGLGLTIARDIARAMGGDIIAASTPGSGTTMVFTARLPSALEAASLNIRDAEPAAAVVAQMAQTQAQAQAGQNEANEPQPMPVPVEAPASGLNGHGGSVSTASVTASGDGMATSSLPTRPCLVLLAEDNDINALVAANFLEIIGVQTERVKDGEEAVREALRLGRRPDLILMDCHMPVMSGHEAAQMIRAKEQALGLHRIPIVALTATASDTERQDCLDAGMDDFLSKPCTLEDLSSAVGRWSAAARMMPTMANVLNIGASSLTPSSGPGSQPATAGSMAAAPPLNGSSAASPGASRRA